MGSWRVEAENGSGRPMPKGLGTREVITSFPLGQFGDPNPSNKLTNKVHGSPSHQPIVCLLLPGADHLLSVCRDQSGKRLSDKDKAVESARDTLHTLSPIERPSEVLTSEIWPTQGTTFQLVTQAPGSQLPGKT